MHWLSNTVPWSRGKGQGLGRVPAAMQALGLGCSPELLTGGGGSRKPDHQELVLGGWCSESSWQGVGGTAQSPLPG